MSLKSETLTVSSLALLYAVRMLGLFMVLPVLFIYGDSYQGASAASLGFALGVYGLTQALFQLPLGLLSDVLSRKFVIVAGLLVFALGSLLAASADTVQGLILGRALQGAGAIASTIMALVSDLTSDKNRSKAMAAIGASIGLSFLLAMILGPLLATSVGLRGIFIFTAVLAGIGILVVLFLVPTPPSTTTHRDAAAIPGLIQSSLRHAELMRLNFGIFTLHAVLTAMFVAVPLLLTSLAGVTESDHWQVYLPVMLCSFVIAVPIMVLSEKKGKGKEAFIFAVAMIAVALLMLSLSSSGKVLLAMVFLFFVAFNLLEAMLPSLVSKTAPAGAKGTAMGVYSTAQFSGAFIGGAIGGLLMETYGVMVLFATCSALVSLWFIVAVFMRAPRNLARMSFAVEMPVDDVEIMSISGIEEAVYVPEEDMLYLKVDKQAAEASAIEEHLLSRGIIVPRPA